MRGKYSFVFFFQYETKLNIAPDENAFFTLTFREEDYKLYIWNLFLNLKIICGIWS